MSPSPPCPRAASRLCPQSAGHALCLLHLPLTERSVFAPGCSQAALPFAGSPKWGVGEARGSLGTAPRTPECLLLSRARLSAPLLGHCMEPKVGLGRGGGSLQDPFGAPWLGPCFSALLSSAAGTGEGGFPPQCFDGVQTGPGVLSVCSCRWG